jgi:hypothetical protein
VTSLYAFQVTEESRKLSDALAATELVLAREQHLTQLDGLAAAAAHELGTPLSTIVLISRELERTLAGNSLAAGDIKTLREQSQRCRDILAKITQLSSTGAPFDHMKLSTLIEETVAPHRDFGVAIKVRIAVAATKEPVGTRNPAILYGVGNTTGQALRPKSSSGSASLICRAGAIPMSPRASMAGLGLACSSPERCWNEPAPRSRSRTVFSRSMAQWCRSRGPDAASRRAKA